MSFDPKNIVLVGVKKSLVAVSKHNGQILWKVELPGSMGAGFVNITSDDSLAYVHSSGKLHGVELKTGKLLWSNELSGFGYGIATLHVPGNTSQTNAAAAEHHFQQQRSDNSASTTSST